MRLPALIWFLREDRSDRQNAYENCGFHDGVRRVLSSHSDVQLILSQHMKQPATIEWPRAYRPRLCCRMRIATEETWGN